MGRVRPWSRALLSAVVQAVARGALDPGLHLEEGAPGRADPRPDAGALGAVPEVRLPTRADLPRATRLEDEPGASVPALAPRWAAGAPETASAARGCQPAAPLARHRAESGLGIRLRLRRLRQRTAAQVPDHHRRVESGVPRHRRGGEYPFRPCPRGAQPARERAWRRGTSGATTGPSSSVGRC